MDRIKIFSGSVSSNTIETIDKSYGTSATEKISRERTDVLNYALEEFLNECGVDVNYDGNYLWINGVPVVFYFYQNYYYYSCCFPFNSTAIVTGSTTTTDIFNGNNYNFKIRLLGEPTGAFYLVISRNYAAPTFSQVFGFFKATNFINERNSRLFRYGTNLNIYAIDLDDDGSPIDIGRNTAAGITCDLNILAVDYSNNADKYPLVEWNPAIFKAEGCYYGLPNSPLPAAAAQTSDAQTFIKLGDDTYYRSYNGPLIKCIS